MKQPSHVRQPNILLAAPNVITIRGIKSVLRPNNYVFLEHIGRVDNLLKQTKIEADILILDVDTPESLGPTTIKKLKTKNPGLKIIIVNLLHHLPGRVRSLVKGGADACISKYTGQAPLQEGVAQVLKGKNFLCPLCVSALTESFYPKTEEKKEVKLTDQERKIIKYLAEEYYNVEIADELGISLRTVETHRKNMMLKIGARNLAGITRYAMKHGLVK